MDCAVEYLKQSQHAIALTGAGISVDSGIPDFRSPGGLWDKFDPFEYAHIDAFRANPVRVWDMLAEMTAIMRGAAPNAGHRALADLERQGVLKAIVTQNIDNLHQAAGSRRVIEFHGNGRKLVCLYCNRSFDAEDIEREVAAGADFPPRCPHDGHILKPNAVFFGEPIPPDASQAAFSEAESCDAILVVGTSATVFPASGLPLTARHNGAKVIEINRTDTGLTHSIAHVSLRGSTTELLPELVRRVGAAGA